MKAVELLEALIVINTSVATTFFVAVYATRPWYKSSVGRSIMMWSSALMVFTWVGLVASFVEFAWDHWLLVGTYAVIGAGAIYQDVVLVRTIKRQKKDMTQAQSEM